MEKELEFIMKVINYVIVMFLPVLFLSTLFFTSSHAQVVKKDFSLKEGLSIEYVEEDKLEDVIHNFKGATLLVVGDDSEPIKEPSVEPMEMYLNKDFIEEITGNKINEDGRLEVEKKFKDLDFWTNLGFSNYSLPISFTMQHDSSNLLNYLDKISKDKANGLKISVSFNSGGYPKFKCTYELYK